MSSREKPLISLTLHSGRDAHEDLVFRFWNGDEFVCDSYFLQIDQVYEKRWMDCPWPRFFRSRASRWYREREPQHLRFVTRELLEQWRRHLVALPDGDAITLPFDLSDQCSTFLRCRRDGGTAHLSIIGSLFEGWGVRVNDITHVLRDPAVLRGVQIPTEHAAPLAELLADLDSIIASLT